MTRINYTIEQYHAHRADEIAEELRFITQFFLEDCKTAVRDGRHQKGVFAPEYFEIENHGFHCDARDYPKQGMVITSLNRDERQRAGWSSIGDLLWDYYEEYGVDLCDLAIARFKVGHIQVYDDSGYFTRVVYILADGTQIEECSWEHGLHLQDDTVRIPRDNLWVEVC